MRTRFPPAVVAVAAFIARFLRLGAIENDHYVYLARAHQLLHGDWPVRDFADPGLPLGYLLSAAAAAIAGPTLLTEAVLSVALFAVAAAITFALARRASGSAVAGLAAAAFVVLLPPRLYSSSKMLVPVAAIALAWAYADRPSARRAAALGAWTGIAFLFRHDYAAYVGGAAVLLLAVRHWGEGARVLSRAAILALVAAAVVAPWLIYVQAEQGLAAYLAAALRFSAAEASRTASHWAPVFYAVAAVPVAALLLCGRGTRTLGPSHVVFATAALLLSDLVLLRDAPGARLPDVYATTAVAIAIVVGRFMPMRSGASNPPSGVMSIAGAAAVGAVVVLLAFPMPALPDALDLGGRWQRVTTRLREARPEIMPNPGRAGLVRYLAGCTTPDERVLVGGFAPELPVLAHRAFAGGLPDWIRGYYENDDDVSRARRQLAREPVAVAVMLDGGDAFAASWPAVAGDLRARGLRPHLLTLPSEQVELWIRPADGRDAATGLPCRPK